MSILDWNMISSHKTMDFIVCVFGFTSFAGFIAQATPYFVFFSALFSCILFGIRVYVTIRDWGKKSENKNSYVNGGEDYSQKDLL